MGLFNNFRSPTAEPISRADVAESPTGGFTVIDVETTGLSARQDRVLELAVVRTDVQGRITGEWTRRVDPEGPVGATHIHGINAADVVGAPTFRDLIPNLNSWLAGTVVVAHNARFDLAFLRAEYVYAGWALPRLPSLCTMEASNHYLPGLDRQRLGDCCAAARVRHDGAHSALGDARATAGLLAYYLDPKVGSRPRPADFALLGEADAVRWPTAPSRNRQTPETAARIQTRIRANTPKAPMPDLVQLLAEFSLIDALDEGAPAGTLTYLEALVEALEDGEISNEEVLVLNDVASLHELSDEDRRGANRALLLALCHLAIDDGMVSRAERAELRTVSQLLGLPESLLAHTLDQAEAARHARLSAGLRDLPDDWAHGAPLRVGDKVAFTGCDEQLREQLEKRAEKLGVRIMNNVSCKTAMLVTDGEFSGTKAEAARQAGSRIVHPHTFEVLLKHLQPADVRVVGAS